MAKKKKKRMGSDPLSWIKDSRKTEKPESIEKTEPAVSVKEKKPVKKTEPKVEKKPESPKPKAPDPTPEQDAIPEAKAETSKKTKKAPARKRPRVAKKPRGKSSASGSPVASGATQSTVQKRQFCTFWISGRMFGVNIQEVKEVNREIAMTKIYHAAHVVKGLVNIRGQINIVIDLRQLMGFEPTEITEKSRIVIFKPEIAEALGALVDQMGDVVEVTEDSIEPISETPKDSELSHDDYNLYSGVCKLDNVLMVILNAKNLMDIKGTME